MSYRYGINEEVYIVNPTSSEYQRAVAASGESARVVGRKRWSKDPTKYTYKVEFIRGNTIWILEDRLGRVGEKRRVTPNACPKCATMMKPLFISMYCPNCNYDTTH